MRVLRLATVLLLLLTLPAMAQTDAKKGKKQRARKKNAAAVQQADPAPDEGEDDEAIPRAVPVFDPGSHTRPIRAMGFTTDASKLVTVAEDFSVQVWSVATGERLDILRLPAYGHEQGYNSKVWNIAAVSRDGRLAAIGGGQKNALSGENSSERAKLLLVDVFQRKIHRLPAPAGVVTALAFSPDGSRLAASLSGAPQDVLIFNNPGDMQTVRRGRRQTLTLTDPNVTKNVDLLEFNPAGDRLLAVNADHSLSVWDLATPTPRLVNHAAAQGHTTSACWSADGQRIARTWTAFVQNPHGFDVRSADGALVKEVLFGEGTPFDRAAHPWGVHFTGPETLLLSLYGPNRDAARGGDRNPGPLAGRFDLASGTFERLFQASDHAAYPTIDAVSSDGQLAAITVSMGLDTLIYRLSDGRIISRCGADSPLPTLVGWAAAGQPAGFAWSEERRIGRNDTQPNDLQFGFDLTAIEPISVVRPEDYTVRSGGIDDWSISRDTQARNFLVVRGSQTLAEFPGAAGTSSMTLVPQPGKPPLVAWARRPLLVREGGSVALTTCEGESVIRLRPNPVHTRDMAPSHDGRFLISSNGTHRLCIHTTDRAFPLLSFARVKGEWVIWSQEGYYAASPGGEKMIGWSVSNGTGELATFHTAEKFAKHFRRPDLLKRAVELGSMSLALSAIETRAPSVEQFLPPKCDIKLISQSGGRVQVAASATPGAAERPVVALRILLDGRPLSGGEGSVNLKAGDPAEATWQLNVPAGRHELKVLARSDDAAAVSDPLVVICPRSASQQPVLHRLCVGINQYALPALNLTSAARDAHDVYAAFDRYCVGPNNRFGTSRGALLTDQQATRQSVLQAISDIRRSAKPGDLVVFLFAGHGVKQGNEYYLLSHEADPNLDLKGRSISGEDLRTALADVECPVLLMLDACHSAQSVKAFRPATDDLTRNLTDDSAGVTVLAAAMAHEVATATTENGHFTAAFLKALQLGQGVPYDLHDHVLYTHHVYSVIFSEVRKATQGKQNPFLNMPWTVPPLALRDVP